MRKIAVGQVWLDDAGIWTGGYDGEMVYVVCSREYNEPWLLMCFQEWRLGAHQTKRFNEEEINRMKYVGELRDLKPRSWIKRLVRKLGRF